MNSNDDDSEKLWTDMRPLRICNPSSSSPVLPTILKKLPRGHQLQKESPREDEKTVVDSFEDEARRSPDQVAVVFNEKSVTYRELNGAAEQLAARLRAVGVRPEVVVGLYCGRSPEMLVGLLGILKAGGAYLPIDASCPADRLEFMLRDSGAKCLVTEPLLSNNLRGGIHRVFVNNREQPPTITLRGEGERATRDNLAYVIYTSGTTGRPKGVMIEHRALMNHAAAIVRCYGLSPRDRVLQFAPLGFDVAAEEIYPTWIAGGAVVIIPEPLYTAPSDLMRFAERAGVTVLNLPTPYWHECVTELCSERLHLPASLRTLVFGSDKAFPQKVAQWQECVSRRVRMFNAYGPTETTITTCLFEVPPGWPAGEHPTVPIGRPLENVDVYILDASGKPVPDGEPGELLIGGEQLARGYIGQPRLTAEKFTPNPFGGNKSGKRLYHTGDLGRRLPYGTVEYLGRLDSQVKIRGKRVELEEVENMLSAHPAVCECAVMLTEAASGDVGLAAYITTRSDQKPEFREIRDMLLKYLPRYMVPNSFFLVDRLPHTPHGKLDRHALSALTAIRLKSEADEIVPRTYTEQMLATIWGELLNMDQVSVMEDFFEIGGHSLLAVRMVSRVGEVFKVALEVRDVFELRTIERLALLIEEEMLPGGLLKQPMIEPMPRAEAPPLSFIQQRLWQSHREEPRRAELNITLAVHLSGPLDEPALAWALNQVVRRHETLRTRFPNVNHRPQQIIEPEIEIDLKYFDLSALSGETCEVELRRAIRCEAERPFDLAQAPLFRARVFYLTPKEHVLELVMHRIISDEWSIGLLLRDLSRFYFHRVDGCPLLEELRVHYADYAHWEHLALGDELLQTHLTFWRNSLSGWSPAFPTNEQQPPEQRRLAQAFELTLPEHLAKSLITLSHRLRLSLFTILLAAFRLLVGRYTGYRNLIVAIPTSGRRGRPEIELVIGPFASFLPFRTDIPANSTFTQFLHQVREAHLKANLYQSVPFDRLIQELQIETCTVGNPLLQVVFDLKINQPQTQAQLTVTPILLQDGGASCDLKLTMQEYMGELSGVFEYNPAHFDAPTIQRVVQDYKSILQEMATNPDKQITAALFLEARV